MSSESTTALNLPFASTHELVVAIRDKYFRDLFVLPYNRHDVEHSEQWWLSPTREKAAFRFPKFIFATADSWVPPGEVFCGIHIEKGLVHEGLGKSNLVLRDDWFWHRLLERAGEPLDALIECAAAKNHFPLQLSISAGLLEPKDATEDKILFSLGGKWSQDLVDLPEGILQRLSKCENFDSFSHELKSINGERSAWHWINVIMGASFTMHSDGPNHLENCAAMLSTFSPWINEVID